MEGYVCTHMPACASRMFTEGEIYPVVSVEKYIDIIRDNHGHERCLLRESPSFIVQNDHWRGGIYRATFERRENQ